MIGGWNGYQAMYRLHDERERYPAFRIPLMCVPASIDNNLPGSELAIGADTALNVIVEAIDRIKQSAAATRRSFVVETMGRYCGYLALMGGLAGGSGSGSTCMKRASRWLSSTVTSSGCGGRSPAAGRCSWPYATSGPTRSTPPT